MAHPWTYNFLRHLAGNGCIAKSAHLAGISSSSVYSLRKVDDDFDAAVLNAIEDSTDVLELEARRRAVEGVNKPVVYQGQLTPVWQRDEFGEVITRKQTRYKENGDAYEVELPLQAIDDLGNPIHLTVSEYSDSLLAMLLKGNRRAKYGDKQEITGFGGGPVLIDEVKRVSRVAALLGLARVRKEIG